jgi:hypothetical protein
LGPLRKELLMVTKRVFSLLGAFCVAGLAVLGMGSPAQAAGVNDKLQIMSGWTQSTATSYGAWNHARQHQEQWQSYQFDWSTDYCTTSPDQPLGFDFRMPCSHHDWGYRNYHAMNQFDANKSRLDDTFYYDLRQVCKQYPSWRQAACNDLAWTYYQVVKNLGYLAVDPAEIDRAARTLAESEARHAAEIQQIGAAGAANVG